MHMAQDSLNNPFNSAAKINFGAETASSAPLSKPIETVQKSIEASVDSFVKKVDTEKEKKSNKTAIAVGSSVLVVTALVAILNPKYSSKLMSKLTTWQHKTSNKVKDNKDNYVKSKFHKACLNALNWCTKTLEFSNNINSAKDIGFKWLCTEKKEFLNVRNSKTRSMFKKADSGFRKIMKKPHEAITTWFDNISKHTVKGKYKHASQKMDEIEEFINQCKDRLPTEKRRNVESKLLEISKTREFFSDANLNQRFLEQEKSMSNLERDFLKKYRSYKNGFTNKWTTKSEHISNNMSFWAQDIMMPTRNKLEKEGHQVVDKLVGSNKDQKGLYNEILEIMSPHLSQSEKLVFEKSLKSGTKKLQKANHSECVEYFDKKRDLVLGGAPTDIVTALGGLGLSGTAIAVADDKEQRISRALTGGFPIIAGIGASMAFTAMLFSGVQGMILGALTSIGLSKIGSIADHYITGNHTNTTKNEFNTKPQEVTNV